MFSSVLRAMQGPGTHSLSNPTSSAVGVSTGRRTRAVNAYMFVGRTAIVTGYREDESSVGLNLHSFCPQTFLGFPKHSSAPC